MKKIYSIIAILFVSLGFAQIPAGYYNTATGTGNVLKTQLYNIINGHTALSYDALWTTYQTSDRDNISAPGYENDNTIYDMYSENPNGADPYQYTLGSDQCGNYSGENSCYNREHIVPQSVFSENSPMVSDAHHIPPTDGYVNNRRGNDPHGTVATANWTSLNGSKYGSSSVSGYSGNVFEPLDAFKGDIARMYFYFVTRYENTVASYDYDMFNHTNYPSFTPAFLSMLISWHNLDPVSQREIDRNNAIYARQGNRNPYIDHPEYVQSVWTGVVDTEAPTAATNLAVTGSTSSSVSLNWTAGTDNIGITSYDVYVNGVYNSNTSAITKTVTGLAPSTIYSFYVIAKDASANSSPASNSVNGTTLAPGAACSTSVTENFETIPANASAYTTNNWTNGGITWTATDSRTDQTINTRAITIRNGSLTGTAFADGIADLTVTTQLKFSGAAGSFKLKVNGTEVGTIPYGAVGVNTTTTIPGINVTGSVIISFDTNSTAGARVAFDNLSWTCYSGTLSNVDLDETNFRIYPNPSNGNFNIDFENSHENYSIEIFSLLGQKVFEKININSPSISVTNLQQGMYLVKLTKDSKSIVKKIVIN